MNQARRYGTEPAEPSGSTSAETGKWLEGHKKRKSNMAFEQNDNSGSLFKNDRKREGKQDADYQGSIKVEGKEFWLNAWLNKDKNGRTYMGLRLKRKEARLRAVGDNTDPEVPF